MEFISPVLINLNDETAKINNILPKFSDIKTEMTNTADIVRNMRIDLVAIKKKITDGSKENLTTNKEIINSSNKLVNFTRRGDSVLLGNTAATSDSNTLYKEQTLRNSPVKKNTWHLIRHQFCQQQNCGTTKC